MVRLEPGNSTVIVVIEVSIFRHDLESDKIVSPR